MARFAILLALVGCWRGDPPPQPPPPNRPVDGPTARAVTCPDGRTLMILEIRTTDGPITAELPYKLGDSFPNTFVDQANAQLSPCLHGCSPGRIVVEQVTSTEVIARYDIAANAGPEYHGVVRATWIGKRFAADRCRGPEP